MNKEGPTWRLAALNALEKGTTIRDLKLKQVH